MMRIFLVGGCHPVGHPTKWKLASNVFGVTTSLRKATLLPFTAEWAVVAQAAAHEVKRSLKGEWVPFAARVLVLGDQKAPFQVIPAWRLEGEGEPQDQRYYFNRVE